MLLPRNSAVYCNCGAAGPFSQRKRGINLIEKRKTTLALRRQVMYIPLPLN